MITDKENKRISKLLSFVLRHQPAQIGIELDENGWTEVETLIQRMNDHGLVVSKEMLRHVVNTNSKKRFSFSDDMSRIRANQGHSVDVALNYEPTPPPEILYHGTAASFVPSIMATGIEKRDRHHVHLSGDESTAINVGGRHGKPVVLSIAALEMFRDGHVFYLSDNKVWLTEHVPAKYIRA